MTEQQMTKKKALQILNIPNDVSINEEIIKKAYRTMALKYHPDKNNSEEANDMFIMVQESYDFLKGSQNGFIDNDKKDYISILQSFLRSLIDEQNQKKIIFEIVKKIINICEDKAIILLEKIDKHVLKTVFEMIFLYKDVLHFSNDFLEKIRELLKNKFDKDERIILHPFLDDLFENNLYKLHIENKLYIIPLWHHHLTYDIEKINDYDEIEISEIYIDCYPILPDNVYIDDRNDIHVYITKNIHDIWNNNFMEIVLGSHTFSFNKDNLFLKKKQTYILEDQGIPIININNIYDITKKSDIILYITII